MYCWKCTHMRRFLFCFCLFNVVTLSFCYRCPYAFVFVDSSGQLFKYFYLWAINCCFFFSFVLHMLVQRPGWYIIIFFFFFSFAVPFCCCVSRVFGWVLLCYDSAKKRCKIIKSRAQTKRHRHNFQCAIICCLFRVFVIFTLFIWARLRSVLNFVLFYVVIITNYKSLPQWNTKICQNNIVTVR